jgi:Ca2+-transporting ATPase
MDSLLNPAPYSMEPDEVVASLNTDSARGLSRDEASSRLARHGSNQLPETSSVSPLRILLDQFRSLLVIILLAAATLAFVIWLFQKETAFPYDTIVIMAIVLANAGLGFYQEYSAEQSLEKLLALTGPEATVIRSGTRLGGLAGSQ